NSLAFIESAQERGVGTLQEINALMDLTTRKYETQTKAIQEQTVVYGNLTRAQIDQAKAAQAGKNFQDSYNQSMGIGDAPGKSARESFAVFEEAGAIPQADKHMQQLGNSTKATRYEMINLGRQANDV